ncbi:flagellar hook-associated protein FlgK [Desulfoscipio sp. XC116]|uniref:flagellar hook-associated protein FlgK n=1 Tax=Desulfoscipio sp. XC116 TaxID=3144975 RepID=UPI00325A5465
MPGSFSGIELARRALQTHQISLETTGHNLANAGTAGYSRQQAVHSATDPYTNPVPFNKLTVGQLGTGVEVRMIRRIRNEYLDTQVRTSTSAYGYWATQEQLYARIESIFTEPTSDGIGDVMTNFFEAWHDLNNSPQDPGVKAAVAELGDELANLMRESHSQLGNISESIVKLKDDGSGNLQVDGGQLKDQVDVVNDILKQVRDLTQGIKKVYAYGNQPNDLLDKRDLLLDQLAEYVPLNVINKNDSGEIELQIFGQEVDFKKKDADYPVATIQYDETNDDILLTMNSITGSSTVSLDNYTDNAPPAGSILSLEMTRNKVEEYRANLVDLSEALKKMVNDQAPFDADSLSTDEFFSGTLGDANDVFRVNPEIMTDPTVIDGEKALNVARWFTISMDGGNVSVGGVDFATYDLDGATFSEYYNAILTNIGANSSTAMNMTDNQYAINEQILSVRDSAQGVNVDEELSMLLQFQYGYQASARVMTTLDELLDHLINRTA